MIKKILVFFGIVFILGLICVFGPNLFMVATTNEKIIYKVKKDIPNSVINNLSEKNIDCIMVLGAHVNPDGSPSLMLKDRLDTGIELYKKKVAPKILLTGDHGKKYYDEVNNMKKYVLDAGVKEEDIFLDHAGFSTYDSVYRASEIFKVERMVIVTQTYHLYRSLYGANKMGMEVYGVASDQKVYSGQELRDIREVAARDKDFIKWVMKPESKYSGESIPINGSGERTQD